MLAELFTRMVGRAKDEGVSTKIIKKELNEYSQAADRLGDENKRLKKEMEAIRSDSSQKIEKKNQEAAEKARALDEKARGLDEKVKAYEGIENELKKEKETRDALQGELSRYKDDIGSLENTLNEKADLVKELKEKIETVEAQNNRAEVDELSTKLNDAMLARQTAEQRIEEFKLHIEKLEDDCDQRRVAIEGMSAGSQKMLSDIREVRKIMEENRKAARNIRMHIEDDKAKYRL